LSNTDQTEFPLSKIRRIAIELKDYYFFHSPYQTGQGDKRFIGRQRKIDQLKNILNNTVSNSGNYLITGYRGAGKTSFVNMVLTEIELPYSLSGRIKQICRIWVGLSISLLFFLFYLNLSFMNFLSVMILLIFFSWWYLFHFNSERPVFNSPLRNGFIEIKTNPSQKMEKQIRYIIRIGLFIPRNGSPGDTLNNLARSIIIVSLGTILIQFIRCMSNWFEDIISCQFFFIIILFFYWLLLRYVDLIISCKKGEDSRWRWFWSFGKDFFEKISIEFKKRLKPRLVIRLNLNYENLTERNLLGLISHSLYKGFKRWRYTYFQLSLRIFLMLLLWCLVSWLYQSLEQNYPPFRDLKSHLKNKIIRLFDGFPIETQNKFTKKYGPNNSVIETEYSHSLVIKDSNNQHSIFFISIYNDLNRLYTKFRGKVHEIYKNSIPYYIIDFFFGSAFFKYLYPPTLKPLLLCCFIFIFILLYCLRHSNFLNLPGQVRVLRLLKELDERTTAAITLQSGMELKTASGLLNWLRRKQTVYPLADERTIEQGILLALEEISRMFTLFGHPNVIFVFDELDKIALPEETIEKETGQKLNMSSYENMRRRLQQVEKILSNLKQLLTTAYAKFIFIAGSDMYDASLADFTGRTSLHSSIFNQTFYVNSFLTDHSDPDENILTEAFVCRFLLPTNEKAWPKVNDFMDYVEKRFEIKNEEVKEKIRSLLQDFIYYLTYRGNGSPKKITELMERFIKPLPPNTINNEWIIFSERQRSHYLVFNFPQQFEIGCTARLLNPVFQTLQRATGLLNDKLATSLLMVLDYLFKFHRAAFRVDCLERMPEMLYIHRDPDLRNVISEILRQFETTYLEKVHNGLFDYRFTNRIKGEIDFAARISDLESAAFNFSLDETRESEQYLRRQLQQQLETYQKEGEKKQSQPKYNIGRLYEMVGDLHAFDEEYDQAITEYFNALEYLENETKNKNEVCQ